MDNKSLLALSWNIATHPKLYWKLALNPYSPQAQKIISKKFSKQNNVDIIKAVILAEPEGKYDRHFKQLSKTQQEKELRRQKEISIELNKRLSQYGKRYAKELRQLPSEFVYSSLSLLIFETTNVKEVEKKYAQNQRRDFKLSIVNFIEDRGRLISSSHRPSDIKSALTKPLFKVVFAVLSIMLLLSLSYGLYESRVGQTKEHILGIEAQEKNQEYPVRLKIPSISVDAAIENVGLSPKGEMEVPSTTQDVGWFKLGPRPGYKGSAVIAGHFDGENNTTGVFTNLHKLKTGDKLYVEDNYGKSIVFVVRESRTYEPGYAEEVFNRNDNVYLNLITCDGVWDKTKKSYSKRLVVFAEIAH